MSMDSLPPKPLPAPMMTILVNWITRFPWSVSTSVIEAQLLTPQPLGSLPVALKTELS